MMNEDLLQDLVLYKKSHEKAVSIAARSLITLFREVSSLQPHLRSILCASAVLGLASS
jgi:hypothetical protein